MTIAAPHLNSLPLSNSANRALAQFLALTHIQQVDFTGASLLYERAVMQGLVPQAGASPNGSCHLLRCQDAVLAVNLPRSADWELLPAWLGPWHNDIAAENITIEEGNWPALEQHLRSVSTYSLLPQAHCLGLAVSIASTLPSPPAQPVQRTSFHASSLNIQSHRSAPLVVDLSSLWAGPLCSHLLQLAGCNIIKIEDSNRSEKMQTASADFYRLLNQNKKIITLDFRRQQDIERLKQLLANADIVIEASRPRALRNLGIFAEEFLKSRTGKTWLSITGYGRNAEQGLRIGYGDDAAAAAGLSQLMYKATGHYQIAGDAIADPLTGIHAALFAWQQYLAGGNELIALSLYDTVSYCLHQELQYNRENVLQSCRNWQQWGHDLPALFPQGPRSFQTNPTRQHNPGRQSC